MSTLAIVQRIVAGQAGIGLGDLQPTRPLEELGIDSLAVIEAMFLLEDEFKIQMPAGQIPIQTIQDIADLVDQLQRDQGAAKSDSDPH
jgi:acyl carrier protein